MRILVASKFILAVLLSVLLVACDGAEEREAAYFERGKALYEEGDLVKAQLEFKNALQINPKNADALFFLAQIAKNQGNIRGSFAILSKLVTDNPKYLPAQVELGKLFFIVGKTADAIEKADLVLLADPKNADAKALKGAIALNAGKIEEAEQEAEAAIGWDPGNVYAASVYASALKRRGHKQEATEVLDRALARKPGDVTLRLLKIQIFTESQEFPKAEAIYRELVELRPDQVRPRVDLAKFLTGRDRLDEAERVLRDAIEALPTETNLKLYLVDFLHKKRSPDSAEKQLTAFIEQAPKTFEFRFALARLHRARKADPEAEKIYQEIMALDREGPHGIAARLELARYALRRGDRDTADKYVAEILKLEPENGKALLVRASRFIEARKYLDAVTDLRIVLRDEPNSKVALNLLAQAYLRSQQVQLAKETLQTLVKVDPSNNSARIQLAQLHARSREFGEARRLVAEALGKTPNYVPALRTKIGVMIAEGQISDAEETARRLLDQPDQQALGHELLARIYQSAGRFEDAAREFRAVIDKNPKSVFAQIALASTYLSANKPEQARASLEAYSRDNPEDPLAHELLGQVLVLQRDIPGAEQEFQRSADLRGDVAGTFGRFARYLLSQRLYKPAIDAFLKALGQDPENKRLLFDLATTHQLAGNNASAIEIFERLNAIDGSLDAVANNLAALIADFRFRDKEALNKALRLAAKFKTSQNPYFLDTLGWVQYRMGNLDEARQALEQAARLGRPFAQLHYHLGMVYFADEQFENAKSHLDLALKDKLNFTGVEEAREALKRIETRLAQPR